MPGGTGDPHVTTLDGHTFDFTGHPGEVYNVLTAHGISVHATVKDVAPGVQVWDRAIIHGPGFDLTIHHGRTELKTPHHAIVVKHDPGHEEPEGDVRPDPLLGDVPHLDFGISPHVALDDASGLMVDGHERSEAEYRIGVVWPSD